MQHFRGIVLVALALALVAFAADSRVVAQVPPTRAPVTFTADPIGDDVILRMREQDERESLARSFPFDVDWGLP